MEVKGKKDRIKGKIVRYTQQQNYIIVMGMVKEKNERNYGGNANVRNLRHFIHSLADDVSATLSFLCILSKRL